MKRDGNTLSSQRGRVPGGATRGLVQFVMIFFLLAVFIPVSSFAQSCPVELKVANNIESVNEDGRVYFMKLINTSDQAVQVDLSLGNSLDLLNPDGSGTDQNVALQSVILVASGAQSDGRFIIEAGAELDFLIKVTVAAGTPSERWNQTKVSYISSVCPSEAQTLTLFTFIPDLTQE